MNSIDRVVVNVYLYTVPEDKDSESLELLSSIIEDGRNHYNVDFLWNIKFWSDEIQNESSFETLTYGFTHPAVDDADHPSTHHV